MKPGSVNRIASIWIVCAALLGACTSTPPGDASTAPSGTETVDRDIARAMARNCYTCHGPAGKSPGSMPSLVQLSAQDIATKLRQFKRGEIPSTVMTRHARAYSEAEIDALAQVIANAK